MNVINSYIYIKNILSPCVNGLNYFSIILMFAYFGIFVLMKIKYIQ